MSLSSFIFGIATALATFLVTDYMKRRFDAGRFRQRIASDIEGMVRNYWAHQPILHASRLALENELKKTDPQLVRYTGVIWSNTYSLLPHLIDNSAYLLPSEFTACVNFYDVYGRLEEIRKAHNEAACHAATSAEDREEHLRFALMCLKTLEEEYETLIQAGYSALRQLATHYSFLAIDERLLRSWESAQAKKQGLASGAWSASTA